MMGTDLNTSLQELFTVMETSGDTLLEELKTALGPTVSNLVPYNLQRVVESHNSRLSCPNQGVGFLRQCKAGRLRLFGGPS